MHRQRDRAELAMPTNGVVRALVTIALLAAGFACGDGEPPEPTPVPKADGEAPRQRLSDTSLSHTERLAAGRQLLNREDGAAFLASRYSSGDRALVRTLLDSLANGDPSGAARLAARLMEEAQGEEKLDFVAFLVARGRDAVPPLLRVVAESRDWQSVVQAMDALGKLKARDGVPHMVVRLRRDPNTWVRIAAAHGLGEVGGGEVIPALVEAVKDTSDTVVAAALIGLGRSGDAQALAPCSMLRSHPNPRVRAAAVSALGRLGGPKAAEYLEAMLGDPDEGVSYKVKRALESLEQAR